MAFGPIDLAFVNSLVVDSSSLQAEPRPFLHPIVHETQMGLRPNSRENVQQVSLTTNRSFGRHGEQFATTRHRHSASFGSITVIKLKQIIDMMISWVAEDDQFIYLALGGQGLGSTDEKYW